MSYEFTKLSEVPVASEFPEGANAIIETNGEIKRCPSAGGSAENVQTDYNQNDSTAADYLKNRPFYTGDPVETVVVEASTVSFANNDGGTYAGDLPAAFVATVGETYKVYWDGTAYECVCVDIGVTLCLGNTSIAGVGSDTGEPFVLGFVGGGIEIYTKDTSASHTISISELVSEVVKINEQYLPNSAFTEADWDFVSNRPLFYKQLNANIIAENITENIRVGSNHVDLGVTVPDFNEGLYYKVEGEILFVNNSANTGYGLQINGYYKADSSAKISLGTVYDKYSRNNLEVSLYGNNNIVYMEKLCVNSSDGPNSYTITANFTIISEVKQLSEDYIPNTIQRVGDDIILSSSTADSTKKFKITVDDSGTLTATEVTI